MEDQTTVHPAGVRLFFVSSYVVAAFFQQ